MRSRFREWAYATPLLAVALVLPACSHSDVPKSTPIAENCGFEKNSPGNEVGVGKYCTKASDCPPVQSGAALNCSSILVDPAFPLLCSRLCDQKAADPGCGTGAICKNVSELGFDVTVCIPLSCQPLFSEPLQ